MDPDHVRWENVLSTGVHRGPSSISTPVCSFTRIGSDARSESRVGISPPGRAQRPPSSSPAWRRTRSTRPFDSIRAKATGTIRAGFLPREARHALPLERTLVAGRRGRLTDRRPQFHHRLIEGARDVRRDELSCEYPDPPTGRGIRHVLSEPEEPGDDADYVPVDGRNRDAERNARNGSRRVGTDSREGCEGIVRGRHVPSMLLDDRLRSGMEMPRPAVESEALPHREDVIEGSCREIADGREACDEPFVVRGTARDPRPLEEILRDEDAIRIPRPAPREIPPVGAVPCEQSRSQSARRRPPPPPGEVRGPTSW